MKSKRSTMKSEWVRRLPLYLEKGDERYKKAQVQIKKFGFSDSETWGLDSVISMFILPRLIRFKELNNGFPIDFTSESWDAVLDEMIFAFDWSLNCEEEKYKGLTKEQQDENWKRYEAGMQLFAKWFRHLWW